MYFGLYTKHKNDALHESLHDSIIGDSLSGFRLFGIGIISGRVMVRETESEREQKHARARLSAFWGW